MRRNIRNTRPYSRSIAWRILLSEDKTAHNTTDPTECHQCSTGECPSPLAADIVSLIRQATRDICICPGDGEENAHVAHGISLCEAHDRQSDNAEHSIENQNRATLLVFVAKPSCAVHNNAGGPIWRGDEALGLADGISHAIVEDDRQEICDSVGDSCQTAAMRVIYLYIGTWQRHLQEDHCESPDLQVESRL